MKESPAFGWILNRFNYLQTYIMVCVLFFLAVLPMCYYWVNNHLTLYQAFTAQVAQVDREQALRTIFMQIEKHRLLMYRHLTQEGKVNHAELEETQSQISQLLQQLSNEELTVGPILYVMSPVNRSNLQQFSTKWQSFRQQAFNIPANVSERLHTDLIRELQGQFAFSGSQLYLYASQLEDAVSIENVLLRIPIMQENMTKLILLTEEVLINNQLINDHKNRLNELIGLIQTDINQLRSNQNLSFSIFIPSKEKPRRGFKEFLNETESLIQSIQKQVLNSPEPILSLEQLINQNETQMLLASNLWEEELSNLKQIFRTNSHHVYVQMWVILGFTLIGMATAFAIGLIITHKATSRLQYLTKATNSFTEGNLSIRVPIMYNDEVGKQSSAFNQMAHRLEGMINHLYELLDATQALANGELSVRIPEKDGSSEFAQIAKSFNHMAANFETIINRLQQLGITLTTSATQIAAASKEQEIIIVEQEATTREIAVAANEISSTAKEFANTMNDVSQVAEQTSSLAFTGKDSLSNMESIMRHMVEASTNIASKLAILNEKAGNITSVITTITKVADQTNLLSLNASIEAEKAGEFGKSFAVIAREIRRLADQTAIATLDIEKMVNEIMTAVSSSVMGVDDFTQEIRNGVEQVRKVSEQLATIIEQVQAFTARFEIVNQGMQAQSTGAEQINESIAQLSQTAQQTTESIHQFHRTIQELNTAANELRTLTPFIHSNLPSLQDPSISSNVGTRGHSSKREPTPLNKTLSDLSSTTNKLKDLNIRLRPMEEMNSD